MMAQKFHRLRRGMGDKETLEACFAIDSDEDRDVVAEVDNTEGRTTEDEVPPQDFKKTAKKSHLMMEPIRKRITAFNAFCSEKQKMYHHPGLGCQKWSKEWKTLSSPEKAAYKAKAKEIGIHAFNPDKCLKNITKMVQQLQENVELSSCKSLCVVTFQKGYLSCRGFGPLARVLQNQSLHALLLGLIEESKITEKKTTSIILRRKVSEELSRITKRDLGLNQFPYQRVKRGEFLVDGVPPELLPLKPPVRLTTKELTQLLACQVTLRRVSTPEKNRLASQQHHVEDTPHQTSLTQHADTSHHTTNTVHQTDQTQHKDTSDCLIPVCPSLDRPVGGLPDPGIALTKTKADPEKSAVSLPNQNVIGLPLPLIGPVQKTHSTYNTDMLHHFETLKETDTIQNMSHNALVDQLPSNAESMDFQLESHDHTHHQASKGIPQLSSESAPQQCSAGTPQQCSAGTPQQHLAGTTLQQCSGDAPQQSAASTPQECAANAATKAKNGTTQQSLPVARQPFSTNAHRKTKKPRLVWDTQALKALEESLGPLETLGGSLPGSAQLDEIRKQKPVLQKFNINQIYQKLYKINHTKS